jgi:branched-chain amino acid aminotransferase
MQKTEKIWMNGRLVAWDDAKTHVLTHTLHYGCGVFEGIRCYETAGGPAVFRLREHMQRLANSAKIYAIKMPYSVKQMCDATKETIRANKLKECYIRPIVYYGYGEMGLNAAAKSPVDAAIACWPWGALLGEEGKKNGIRAMTSSWARLEHRSLPVHAKACGNYMNSILANTEATRAGYDEAILLNTLGYVAEGPGENLFAVFGGRIVTPPTGAGILAGITRDSAMSIARDLGLEVAEQDMMRDELYLADELFFTGTAAEITPIRELDGRSIGDGKRGPVTEKLQEKFFAAVRGKEKRYEKWLDYI